MESQTIKELKQKLAHIKTTFAQVLENRHNAENNRLQAILDREQAERELAANVTKETKTNLKTVKEKLKQATQTYQTADAAVMTVYKQKIHLEDELEHTERKPRNVR
ncbi:hypothetical protein ACJV45_00570 [Gardnerella sp. Marseille-Q9181]|uniref:hypothetical protein n=1 Tax=Gardnerella sp. Marseille-Q9181 TaxID=3383029 RepID=UPI003AF61D7D